MESILYTALAAIVILVIVCIVIIVKIINYYKDKDIEFELKYSEKKKEDK